MSTKLGDYFTLEELTRSDKANELHIDNKPDVVATMNLNALVGYILDPARRLWGSAICVSSGYRNAELNKAVGGSKNSDHMMGLAADIYTPKGNNEKNRELYEKIKKSALPYRQLIFEKSRKGTTWVHVSLDLVTDSPKRQAMIATQSKFGKWSYEADM